MLQVLHIFRKDCRQFWPEIVASLLITAIFCWTWPYQWADPADPKFLGANRFLDLRHLQILATTMAILMVFCWLVVTARVVHAENLIGNRQFWLTRPYRWHSLLSAKLLFVAAFLYGPFAVTQWILLCLAGFSPFHYVPNLLYVLVLFFGIVGLAFLSFASVVSSLLRMILVLGAISAAIAIVAFFASSGHHDGSSVRVPIADHLSTPLFIFLLLAALLAAYSGRRIWLGRALLITLLGTIFLFGASPWDDFALPLVYPRAAPGVAMPLRATACCDPRDLGGRYSGDQAWISVPVEISGISPNHAVYVDNLRMEAESAGGTRVDIPWESVENVRLESSQQPVLLFGKLDRPLFDQLRSKPMRIHVVLAITEIAPDARFQTVPVRGKEFLLPGVGLCSATYVGDFHPGFQCKQAFHSPYITRVTQACQSASQAGTVSRRSTAWVGFWNHDPADFSLTPITRTTIAFTEDHSEEPQTDDGSCQNRIVELQQFHIDQRLQLSCDTPIFQFDPPKTDKRMDSK